MKNIQAEDTPMNAFTRIFIVDAGVTVGVVYYNAPSWAARTAKGETFHYNRRDAVLSFFAPDEVNEVKKMLADLDSE